MDKIYTTLKQIRSCRPCEYGYKKLVKSLGGVRKYGINTPTTFKQIYESNGYNDTLWCLRTVDEKWHSLLRHFACDCADDVRHLMKDQRSLNAIDVSRRFADGLATGKELVAARDAARDAAWDAAGYAARDAAWDAAWDTARVAAWYAAGYAAQDAAWDAAWAAARAAAWDKQMQRLFKYCETGECVK